MKTIKYLLLVLLCYCTAQVYSQNKASWVPDSIASQIPVNSESGPGMETEDL